MFMPKRASYLNSNLRKSCCRSLLQVLEEEYKGGAGALIARLYYDAFQISIAHGDQARASVFAERGYRLIENPSVHVNFGASVR